MPCVGQLPAEIQSTAEGKNLSKGRVTNLNPSSEFEIGCSPEEHPRPLPTGIGWREKEYATATAHRNARIGSCSHDASKVSLLMSKKTELNVAGRKMIVSNIDKVLYPEVGFTKGQVIDYYIRIGPVLLPHLKQRPLTLKRYPDGVEGFFFYEKQCPSHRPDWVKTTTVPSQRKEGKIDYCVMSDLPALVWVANLADLELHTFLHRAPAITRPTAMAFDLDPGAPADIVQCCQVALWLKEVFEGLGMQSFPKTSGSKGLQLYVPLNTATTYDKTKEFAHRLAERLEREHPEDVVSRMLKSLRKGKVLIDWSQNDEHKTTVCAYSLRAKARPTVSTPVKWNEVEECLRKKSPELLTFTSDDVLRRVEKEGDLFEPVLQLKQRMPSAKAMAKVGLGETPGRLRQ
jgi:bifunctional non-homologous end joining protein LigD